MTCLGYLPLHFDSYFPGRPRLAGNRMSPFWILLELSMMEVHKAPVKMSPPTNQHPVFYRPDALPVAQPIVSKHWRENVWDCDDCCFLFTDEECQSAKGKHLWHQPRTNSSHQVYAINLDQGGLQIQQNKFPGDILQNSRRFFLRCFGLLLIKK